MYYFRILVVIALSFMPALWHAYAADDKRSPTWNCTGADCGAPTGGTFMDGHGNTICQDCFDRNFGINN